MKVLVTGSAGHLGEALVRSLRAANHAVVGLDRLATPFTDAVGSITDRSFVRDALAGCEAVLHTATLHKPHVATHGPQDFVDTNITGTLNLLEEAVAGCVGAFVFTSTTSVFGRALTPAPDQPAAWITEDVVPVPKNIYGVTKAAAEDLCQLVHHEHGLACLVLRVARFFPEDDDSEEVRARYDADNAKVNEYLYRRVDLEDVVSAHLLAIERVRAIGFARLIVSATTPFAPGDLAAVRDDAPAVVRRLVPAYEAVYATRGWEMFPSIDRVYVNARARQLLGWRPRHDFADIIARLRTGGSHWSGLARSIGAKGYHTQRFDDGPYPVDREGMSRSDEVT